MLRAVRIQTAGEASGAVFDPPLASWTITNEGTEATLILNREAQHVLRAGGSVGEDAGGEPLLSVVVQAATTVDVRVLGGTGS